VSEFSQEVLYLLLIFGLMVVPRILQRWRVPAPITSFGLGMAAAWLLAGSAADPTVALLASLGISSLFLFAGLEIELSDFVRGRWPLLGHLLLRAATLCVMVIAGVHWFDLRWQVAALLALALVTPSTGFILETLPQLGLDAEEAFWVRLKAIGGELLALLVLFVVLQSESLQGLAVASTALLAMIAGLPLLFLVLGRLVIPYARGSEFSLLVMVGFVAAFATYKLGVYYLVGAFLAGFAARVLRGRLPTLASDTNLHAIQMFASFFVPFYFFHKGMGVPRDAATVEALLLGLLLTVVALPARLALVWGQRRFIKGESGRASLRVAVALSPTLIFTLVLATILRERFALEDRWYGALLVYAGLTTILPSLVLSRPFDLGLTTAVPNPDGHTGPSGVRASTPPDNHPEAAAQDPGPSLSGSEPPPGSAAATAGMQKSS
jgi:Kef-type K+ transport system membrane component KefB